ncbi:unnamed protein product [Caenorhabditis angaria]|uniref:Uncharacterized protein n=1 Tax=Caenorhabditis angaria TaxID=860376 RepID=A0A9P1N6F1_9PELO|nr:unnamed protein product [Caenorhabditis angaria]
MTVVADERVQPENNQNQPKIENSGGIFYRICCCCSTSEKEPPVQLIRSGSLTYQQGSNEAPPQPQISTANESIEGVPEVQPEIRKIEETSSENDEEINVNDILMDEVIRNAEEQEDKTEVLEEDVVSISSHVIQEIDEKDLNDFVKPLKARKATVTNEDSISITSHQEDQEDNRKMSVIEFIRSEAEAEAEAEAQAEAEALEAPQKPARDPEVTQSEISDSEEDQEVPPLPLEPPPRLTTSALENHPIPPPRSPRISKMYQNADDSDSDSDSEEDQEPIGLSKMQPITFAASPKPADSEASSDSEAEAEASSASESEAEEIGVTRISVKSNGQAQIHSPRSPVRVSLDVDRQQIVTDDEFSEKLI